MFPTNFNFQRRKMSPRVLFDCIGAELDYIVVIVLFPAATDSPKDHFEGLN